MPIYEASERVLRAFQDELMPAESLSEFFDVVGGYPFGSQVHVHMISTCGCCCLILAVDTHFKIFDIYNWQNWDVLCCFA